MRSKYDLVDRSTGEVYDNRDYGDMWLQYGRGFKFTKLFGTIDSPFDSHLYNGYFFMLCKHLSPNNSVTYDSGNLVMLGRRFATLKEIAELLGISKRTFYRFLRVGERSFVFSKVGWGESAGLRINPVYAFNGRYLSGALFLEFRNCKKFLRSLNKRIILELDSGILDFNVIAHLKMMLPKRWEFLFGGDKDEEKV